jgi:hypothetical protein
MTVSALRWFKAALVLQILLLAYWLTMEVVDVFPWNDLGSRPAGYDLRSSIAFNALQLLAYMGMFAFGLRPLAMLSILGYAGYLAWQMWVWWKPYALGAGSAWQGLYSDQFLRTLKILPADSAHLAPDVQHIVLHVLILLVLIAAAVAVSRMRHL